MGFSKLQSTLAHAFACAILAFACLTGVGGAGIAKAWALGSEAEDASISTEPVSACVNADELSQKLDEYLAVNYPRTHEPGMAVAVVTQQGIAYLNTLGTCQQADDSFYIGSLSKSMCAVAIMQLVEQGRIDLDESAAHYVPEYLVAPQVTVRMLLNQTSGFGYYDSLSQAEPGDSFGEFSYSNANYDLLGRIVESVSGQPYADYLAQHVFAPLNMVDSSAQGWRTNDVLGEYAVNNNDLNWDDDEDSPYGETRDVLGHRNYFGVYVQDGFQHSENDDDAWGGPSSGYVSSSIRDMANYLQMYLDGGKNVLDHDSVMQMFMSRVKDPDGDAYYGMGWTSYYWDDELVLCHDGDVETNVSSMAILPERGIGVVVLGDGYDSVAGNSQFFDLSSGVLNIAAGYEADDLNAGEYDQAHARANESWAFFMVLCLIPLVGSVLWKKFIEVLLHRKSPIGVATATCVDIVVFAFVITWVVNMPRRMGVPWRDIATFDPSIALGLWMGAGLLACAALTRIFIAVRLCRRARDVCTAEQKIRARS